LKALKKPIKTLIKLKLLNNETKPIIYGMRHLFSKEECMPHYRIRSLIPICLGTILVAGFFLFFPSREVNAQCGSQASSCKNCHETQGQDPVNNDGTAWHTEHAQIDACVSCHAGNPLSTDKTQAHSGMVPWDSDVKAGCASCHPDDYTQLAQGYATTLGVTLGAAGPTQAATTPQATSVTTSTVGTISGGGGGMVVSEPGTIDYVQQYQQTVLGEHPINWGNVIVVLLLIAIIFGGGTFVYWNERRLRGLKGFFPFRAIPTAQEGVIPVVEGYSSEVTELLPLIAKLNPVGLHALKRILANPGQANEMLHAVSHLDPELVRRVQALDKDSRAMLMAVAGN
jgi:hypothetical protein